MTINPPASSVCRLWRHGSYSSQRLDELIVTQYGPTLGPPIRSHQALQAVALRPAQTLWRHDESIRKGAQGGKPSSLGIGGTTARTSPGQPSS
jgi:hypothetical protein